jgi:sn-glycerol 3-phosphate transport system permease protein
MYLKNSLIVVVTNTVLMTIIMVPAAYAFAKCKFFGKDFLFTLLMVSFMVPGCVTFVSIYKMFAKNGLLDSLIPQIIPCICNTWGIFLLRQTFMQVPEELLESARLDEANEFQVITKIMLPMAKSTIVTLMLLSVMGTWNSYFWPLVMTIHDEYRPLPVAIELLKNLETGMNWPVVMAGNFMLVAPVLIAFLVASKKIIAAMAYRGVK